MSAPWNAEELLAVLRQAATTRTSFVEPGGRQPPHAFGVWVGGTFTPNPAVRRFAAPIFDRRTAAVTARFSTMIGGPAGSHYDENNLGLAVRFGADEGDLVAINTALFPVRNPGDFRQFLTEVGGPQRGEPAPMLVFLDQHLDSLAATVAYGRSRARGRPASFAETTYHGAHAFWLAAADGGPETLVRYRWAPIAGDRAHDSWQPTAAGRRGRSGHGARLGAELRAWLRAGPVRFTMMLEVGGYAQRGDDPSAFWPETLERLIAGELELTAVDTAEPSPGDPVFRPAGPPVGWRPDPGDEVMKARAEVYELARR